MTISPAVQALLDQSYKDLSASQVADQAQTDAQTALDAATKALDAAKANDLAAHQVSTKSAHDFIAALAVELNFPLPAGF